MNVAVPGVLYNGSCTVLGGLQTFDFDNGMDSIGRICTGLGFAEPQLNSTTAIGIFRPNDVRALP